MLILIFFWKKLLTFEVIWCNIIKSPVLRRSNGSIAQLGEHLPYKQRVIGSSPIVPTKRTSWQVLYGPIVQLVRTPPCHGGGRGFESHSGRQFFFELAAGSFGTGSRFLWNWHRQLCSEDASVAQSVEQGTENPRVDGSIPSGGTTFMHGHAALFTAAAIMRI